jgi:Arc/MetJ-type ribon-helix-helix transcriptional regulator
MTRYRVAEPQAQWLTEQVAAGAAPSEEAYLARLIDADREEAAKLAVLRAEIAKGLASPVSPRSLDEIFAAAMARVVGA